MLAASETSRTSFSRKEKLGQDLLSVNAITRNRNSGCSDAVLGSQPKSGTESWGLSRAAMSFHMSKTETEKSKDIAKGFGSLVLCFSVRRPFAMYSIWLP